MTHSLLVNNELKPRALCWEVVDIFLFIQKDIWEINFSVKAVVDLHTKFQTDSSIESRISSDIRTRPVRRHQSALKPWVYPWAERSSSCEPCASRRFQPASLCGPTHSVALERPRWRDASLAGRCLPINDSRCPAREYLDTAVEADLWPQRSALLDGRTSWTSNEKWASVWVWRESAREIHWSLLCA